MAKRQTGSKSGENRTQLQFKILLKKQVSPNQHSRVLRRVQSFQALCVPLCNQQMRIIESFLEKASVHILILHSGWKSEKEAQVPPAQSEKEIPRKTLLNQLNFELSGQISIAEEMSLQGTLNWAGIWIICPYSEKTGSTCNKICVVVYIKMVPGFTFEGIVHQMSFTHASCVTKDKPTLPAFLRARWNPEQILIGTIGSMNILTHFFRRLKKQSRQTQNEILKRWGIHLHGPDCPCLTFWSEHDTLPPSIW